MKPVIRPTDATACDLARSLLSQVRTAALAVLTDDGRPMVTRVAFGLGPAGEPLTLISDLSAHTRALRTNPACSLLVGEPGSRGDPLNSPRLTLQASARFVDHTALQYKEMAAHYLRSHPKAKLYIDFADFSFALFQVSQGHLNGGFGKAFVLTAPDMGFAG